MDGRDNLESRFDRLFIEPLPGLHVSHGAQPDEGVRHAILEDLAEQAVAAEYRDAGHGGVPQFTLGVDQPHHLDAPSETEDVNHDLGVAASPQADDAGDVTQPASTS